MSSLALRFFRGFKKAAIIRRMEELHGKICPISDTDKRDFTECNKRSHFFFSNAEIRQIALYLCHRVIDRSDMRRTVSVQLKPIIQATD